MGEEVGGREGEILVASSAQDEEQAEQPKERIEIAAFFTQLAEVRLKVVIKACVLVIL